MLDRTPQKFAKLQYVYPEISHDHLAAAIELSPHLIFSRLRESRAIAG
ncbi:hypothetical protein [Phormidesmis priestleyi]|nr:hypothetical protein [Phormidesmis priestleyi]